MGSEGVVYMTLWWIPVLEAFTSSRLSLVGHTSCPAQTAEDVQKYADTLDPGQFLHFWSFFIKLMQAILYPITYCYVVTSCIWMLFLSRQCSSLPDERFVFSLFYAQAVTMTTGLLSNFPWFMPFSQKCFPLWTITKTITKR